MPPRRTRENGTTITATRLVSPGLVVETSDCREVSAGWLAAWPGYLWPRLLRWNRPNWRQLKLHRIFHQGTPKPSGVHSGPQCYLPPEAHQEQISEYNILASSCTPSEARGLLESHGFIIFCVFILGCYCTPHSRASCDHIPLSHFMYPRVSLLAHGTVAHQAIDRGKSRFVYRSAGLCAAFPRWPAKRSLTRCGD